MDRGKEKPIVKLSKAAALIPVACREAIQAIMKHYKVRT